MSSTDEPMTKDTLDGSYNFGLLSVLQVLAGTIYDKSTPAEREHLKSQLAQAKARPIAKWNRKEEIEFFETPFESIESVLKGLDAQYAARHRG